MHCLIFGVKHCGKSTLGRGLASRHNWPFMDSDDVLLELGRRLTGRPQITIRELFQLWGEVEFRQREAEAVIWAMSELKKQPYGVLALGGGAPCSGMIDREAFRTFGTAIWLDIADDIAWERVSAGGVPPYLAAATLQESHRKFVQQNQERRPFFEALAQVRFIPTGGEVEAEVKRLEELLQLQDSNNTGDMVL